MNLVRFGLPIILLFLAVLNFNTTQNLTLWMVSILVTEYGQWFAVFSLVLMVFWRKDALVLIPLAIAFALFLLPSLQLFQNLPAWNESLSTEFPKSIDHSDKNVNSTQPSWLKLFSLSQPKPNPETFVYAKTASGDLSLDFFKSTRSHAPFILVIHGGGWDGGERTQFAVMNQHFADLGYAVASIDYRLAPKDRWPAQKDDVKHALEYLQLHAAKLGIDEKNWVIFGRSAGGQIAEAFAYQTPRPGGLKGCIAFYSPADLNFAYQFGEENDVLKSPSLLRNYLGGTPKEVPENYNSASAILEVNSNSVPTLLMHGPRDPLVWVKQSERLFAKLQESHVKSAFISIPWATHAFDFHFNGPGGQIAIHSIHCFLEGVLSP